MPPPEPTVLKSLHSPAHICLRELLVADREARLTQGELANFLGKPQSFVCKYERGERRIDVIEFIDIAEALEIDASHAIRKYAYCSSHLAKSRSCYRVHCAVGCADHIAVNESTNVVFDDDEHIQHSNVLVTATQKSHAMIPVQSSAGSGNISIHLTASAHIS